MPGSLSAKQKRGLPPSGFLPPIRLVLVVLCLAWFDVPFVRARERFGHKLSVGDFPADAFNDIHHHAAQIRQHFLCTVLESRGEKCRQLQCKSEGIEAKSSCRKAIVFISIEGIADLFGFRFGPD